VAANPARPARLRPRADDGVTTVEFALVVIVLFYTVMGIIEFGTIFSSYVALTNMARDATRSASVWGTHGNDSLRVAPLCASDSRSMISTPSCICTPSAMASRAIRVKITCTASASVPVFVPLLSNLIGSSLSLSASSSDYSEQ
jgi:Flp pilus assembly protein TadG